MKQYIIGFITGSCLVASAVMFMGAGESNSKIGKYQGFADDGEEYLIDTETGQLYFLIYCAKRGDYFCDERKTALRWV